MLNADIKKTDNLDIRDQSGDSRAYLPAKSEYSLIAKSDISGIQRVM